MTFQDALISAGYVLDEENFDEGCYVKSDSEGFIHIYQIGEDEGEWNYVKMTEDFDVITETTCFGNETSCFVDDSCLPNSAN